MEIFDKKPSLFEKTVSNIWTDPYIQQQMLKEHLNPLSDGASRKQQSILKIVDFIHSNTKPESRLLDLGCGPGLYTSLLADKGYTVTGVDFNNTSIAYASKSRKDVEYLLRDYIKNYPQGKFDAVTMIYCDFGTHSDADRDKLLENIYNSLNDGGVFIFDVFTERIVADKQEGKSWDYAPMGGFWDENKYLLLNQIFHYPEHKAFAYQHNLITEDLVKHFIIWERYYSEEEIVSVLRSAGFRKVAIHKKLLDGNNFTSDSEIFIVARK